jgi:AraC family transcriptional regulator
MVKSASAMNSDRFLHRMESRVEGIQARAPAKWQSYDGIVSAYWDAEGSEGGKGYYLSPDPRIVVFFNDVSDQISMANSLSEFETLPRPMAKLVYLPAGTPLWTSFTSEHSFSHLDIHLHRDRLLKFLVPSLGRSVALAAVDRQNEITQDDSIEQIGRLLAGELENPRHHDVFAESLVGTIVSGLLNIDEELGQSCGARLTQAQLKKLKRLWDNSKYCRLSTAEMAACVQLSESWFSYVFKQTTGTSPMQWQLARRIDRAKALLAAPELTISDVASQLGFSDQAHFTNTFKANTGHTPGAWRHSHQNCHNAPAAYPAGA